VLLAELEDVLSREKFAARITRIGGSVLQMLAGFPALTAIVRPAPLEATARDPDAIATCSISAHSATSASRSTCVFLLSARIRSVGILTYVEPSDGRRHTDGRRYHDYASHSPHRSYLKSGNSGS
jgi:hypothetical protein